MNGDEDFWRVNIRAVRRERWLGMRAVYELVTELVLGTATGLDQSAKWKYSRSVHDAGDQGGKEVWTTALVSL